MKLPIQIGGANRISLAVPIHAKISASQRRLAILDLPFGAPKPPKKALCCGSIDSQGQGSNCVPNPIFSECFGKILACPNGEILTDEGSGSCA